MLNERKSRGQDWYDIMEQAEALGFDPFEGFLAGFATKAADEGLTAEGLREMLMQPKDNLLLNLVLSSEGLSFEVQSEKAKARFAVAVVNLKEAGLWPWS